MDAIDREILSIMQRDARVSYQQLGREVGLSANAAADRVRRLVRMGIIRGFTAIVDPTAGEADRLLVFIDVRLRPDVTGDEFERALARLPPVAEAFHITGTFDYLLRVEVRDARSLDDLIREMKLRAGVAETHTRLVLRTTLTPRPPTRRGGRDRG